MEELIRQAFLHVEVIGPHVAEGHYDLVGPNGDIILPQVWETVIEPDWTITMHMWPIPEKPKTPDPPPPPPPPLPPAEEENPAVAVVEEPKKKPESAAGKFNTPYFTVPLPLPPGSCSIVTGGNAILISLMRALLFPHEKFLSLTTVLLQVPKNPARKFLIPLHLPCGWLAESQIDL